MIRSFFLAILILFPSFCFALKPGDQAPALPSNKELAGKVVFLDFWASWCGPCRRSLPWIASLQQKFKTEEFSVVSVNLDSERSKADALLNELQISLPVIYDSEGKYPELFEVEEMPTSFLLGVRGEVKEVFPGFKEGDKAKIESAINSILAEGKK